MFSEWSEAAGYLTPLCAVYDDGCAGRVQYKNLNHELMEHLELFLPEAVREGNVILKPDCGMHYSNIIALPTHCTVFPSHAD